MATLNIILLVLVLALLYDRLRLSRKIKKERNAFLEEKEWLITEIHHRVKNNLQMVISLLNAQSEFLNNSTAINAIKESRERMEAIALIHKKLYEMDNTTTAVDMRSYIHELIDTIKDCFPDKDMIGFEIEVDDIHLDISKSVPVGLILNEAINNALKHAYPNNKRERITVSLRRMFGGQLQLKITDNGKGLPENIDVNNSKTLGFQLIKLFSEQLDGDLFFVNENGLQIILNFSVAGYNGHHL